MAFEAVVGNLTQVGPFEFLLMFVFFLALLYGLLRRIKLLGEEVSVTAAASAALAFILVNYTPIGTVFAQLFFIAGVLILLLLMFVLLISMLGGDIGKFFDTMSSIKSMGPLYVILGGSMLIALSYFGLVSFNLQIDASFIMVMMFIGIMVIAVWGLAMAPK